MSRGRTVVLGNPKLSDRRWKVFPVERDDGRVTLRAVKPEEPRNPTKYPSKGKVGRPPASCSTAGSIASRNAEVGTGSRCWTSPPEVEGADERRFSSHSPA